MVHAKEAFIETVDALVRVKQKEAGADKPYGARGFGVTYEIVSQESAEHGDAESRGFVDEDCTLSEALSLAHESDLRSVDIAGRDIDDSIRVQHSMCLETGKYESRTIHPPRWFMEIDEAWEFVCEIVKSGRW